MNEIFIVTYLFYLLDFKNMLPLISIGMIIITLNMYGDIFDG